MAWANGNGGAAREMDGRGGRARGAVETATVEAETDAVAPPGLA
ncbi:hypothetical protein [Salana multivorans]|nr:hypothetical protein [Salana multivorans]